MAIHGLLLQLFCTFAISFQCNENAFHFLPKLLPASSLIFPLALQIPRPNSFVLLHFQTNENVGSDHRFDLETLPFEGRKADLPDSPASDNKNYRFPRYLP